MKVKLYDAANIHVCDVSNVDRIEITKGFLSMVANKDGGLPTIIGNFSVIDFSFEVVEDE